ncbi:MAG: SirA family protein [Pseudomonadales bacterium]|nr:SirA family protein [Pseudomonadales bacterium]
MSEQILDTSGLLCPLPVIRTQDAIKSLNSGDTLKITATDPGTMHDIPAWCRVHGHELLQAEEEGRNYSFVVRVS